MHELAVEHGQPVRMGCTCPLATDLNSSSAMVSAHVERASPFTASQTAPRELNVSTSLCSSCSEWTTTFWSEALFLSYRDVPVFCRRLNAFSDIKSGGCKALAESTARMSACRQRSDGGVTPRTCALGSLHD